MNLSTGINALTTSISAQVNDFLGQLGSLIAIPIAIAAVGGLGLLVVAMLRKN